jgi:DNA-directed RNA polymerase subunit L
MGLCPVSQCAYANTIDSDPVRQEQFFNDWMAAYKKVVDPSTLAPEVIENYRAEWRTMAIQRCFMVGPDGQPNSFAFTVESVGVRPVKDIVAEGIRAVIDLVSPYADADRSMEELGMSTMPVENRMNGIVIQFAEQEHTLGNLLQSILTEIYLDGGAPDSPITFAAYKVRHPLHRIMSLTLGFREGVAGDTKAIARQVIAEAAEKARQVFENLGRSWDALVGATATAGAGAAASAVLPEMEG